MSDKESETIERLKKVFNMHPDEEFDSCKSVIISGLIRTPTEYTIIYKSHCLDVLLGVDLFNFDKEIIE